MFNFFRRLQWKLSLSYTIVTAGTVIVLTIFLISIAGYYNSQNDLRTYDSFYWSKTAFQDNIPYLLEDSQSLQTWLERVQKQGFNINDFQSRTLPETLDYANTLVTNDQPIYVLDSDLNLITMAPLVNPDMIGKPFKARSVIGFSMESIIDAASIGDKNYNDQSITTPEGTYLVAFPLRKSDNDPVVAIVIYQVQPIAIPIPSNLGRYQTFFIITLMIVFMVALPVGTIFGWLVTRGLRKRLVTLSEISKAWSKGDFSVTTRDQSGDEIGELTRNLNGMAEQLQTFIHNKDELTRLEERNRLARDLHDTVKQQTYASRMQLTAAKNLLTSDSPAYGHIDAALQLNRETQQELMLIIDELRPPALQGKGLAQALIDYADRWQEHTAIKVEKAVSGNRSLPLEVEQVFYRVSQEALSNIARHAEADHVGLSLNMTPAEVELIVADNGRGFSMADIPSNSYGLVGMKGRIEEIGGTLNVNSTLSVGTTISVKVQLKP